MASRGSRRLTALVIGLALVTALMVRDPGGRDAAAIDFSFVDVPGGKFYELPVYWMLQEGITQGTSSTTYSPDDPVTRAQMAAFLFRFVGAPGSYPDHPFSDVVSSDWFHEPVKWLLKFGITTGTSPTTYSPRDPLTRGQMAAFLHRLAGTPVVDGAMPFGDVATNAYYYDAVRWLVSEKITTGTTATTYSPERFLTRGEMAALLWRYAGEPIPGAPIPPTHVPSPTSSTTTTVFIPSNILPTTTTTPPPGDYVRIVSIPDFFNVDVGTISSVFNPAVGTCGGLACGDSRTDELDRSIWYILESIKTDNPDFVLVAGDLVNGHWYADQFARGVFGPTETVAQKTAAIDRAGDVYYSQWLDRFEQRGLDVYPAVGDHELGDNDWAAGSDRSEVVSVFRSEFAQHFTQNPDGSSKYGGTVTSSNVTARPPTSQWSDTAYAFQYENVLVISLDVFYQQSPNNLLDSTTGSVIPTVRDSQLTWLDAVLTGADNDASIDHVIVQGHTPTLLPVRLRSSSGLYLRDDNTGADTELWKLLSAHDVPVYLSGEVHDITHSRSGGVHQVVHGGIIGSLTPVNYLVMDIYPYRISMHIKQLDVQNTPTRIWQTRSMNTREILIFDDVWRAGFQPTGTLELTKAANGSYSDSAGTGTLLCFGTCAN